MGERRLFLVVVTLLVSVGLSSVLIASYSVIRIDEQLVASEDFHADALDAVLSMEASVNATAQETFAYLVADHEVERDEARAALVKFYELLADYERTDHQPKATEVAASVRQGHGRFASLAEQLFASYEATGDVDDDEFDAFEEALDSLTADLSSLVAIERSEVLEAQNRAVQAGERARDSVLRQGLIVAALALLATGVTVVLFNRLSRGRQRARSDLSLHLQALEATSVGVVIFDARDGDSPLIYVNRGFERITGYQRQDVIGRNYRFLLGPGSDETAIAAMRDGIESAEPVSVLVENYTATGIAFWNDSHLSPIRDEAGAVTHFVGILDDVTDRVRLENRVRRSAKMDAVGQLAGGIAHDFNNYLMVISGAIEVIKAHPEADAESWLDRITEAGKKSAALTTQLMTFAQSQSLNVQRVDMNSVVIALEPLLRGTIPEDIAIEIHTAAAPSFVTGDRSQLEQIVTNLVLNARDAMPDGGSVTIEVGSKYLTTSEVLGESQARPGRYIVLAVTDVGTGINPDLIGEIFEPFVTSKPDGQGAGLGLATVYGIANRANGLVNAYSEPGHGSTFKVYLPEAAADTADWVADPVVSQPGDVDLDRPVLLVEDEAMVREALSAMLVSLGLSVFEAANGHEALQVLDAHPEIEVLITDVTMPEMGGIELAARARTAFPGIKILLVSGYTAKTIERGQVTDPILTKPFNRDELKHKLADLVHNGH